MKLRMHVALALLQFLSACVGVLGLLLFGGMLGYVEPLWRGGKALFAPYLALEGLGLAMVPSYLLAFRLLKFGWDKGGALRVLCLGLIQGVLFPLIVVAMGWMMAKAWMVTDWFGIPRQQATGLTDTFFWILAIFLALAAMASSVISALLMRMVLRDKGDATCTMPRIS